ncbi:MAG TPA: alkaline phosphatase PhoX [Candidatus Limnocylindrales bacterium]|nr:alkaline phosphatase PhoX [Candidatus Limnocylindrales bacterium]
MIRRPLPVAIRPRGVILGVTAAVLVAGAAVGLSKSDPGQSYADLLAAQSQAIYGFGHPLDHAATGTFTGPGDQAVELAKGLTARVVSSVIGENPDMIGLWPDDSAPTDAIICNEITGNVAGAPATLQRVHLADGVVSDIAFGLVSCDPVHRTAWGTIVFGEENGNLGRLYELLDPLTTSGVQIDRATGTTSDPVHVVARTALGQVSYEGLVSLPDGTTYYADELRPSNGKPGGGVYKFVPSHRYAGSSPISNLADSPLAAGSVSVMRLGIRNGGTDFGQGSNTGAGRWVPLGTSPGATWNLAAAALAAGGYTGYYRPEDMDLDPLAWADGRIRACWNNTGNDEAENWGETMCLEDVVDASVATGRHPVVEPFVIGNADLRMPDNLDFQPGTGILYILMDATTSAADPNRSNDSIWACLPDGTDSDILSDGCVRVMNLKDGAAEFTGIEFLGDGKSFLVHLQHRDQTGRAVPGTSDEILVSGLATH